MATITRGEVPGKIDARPVRPTSNKTPWDRALALRNQIAASVRASLEREGLEAAIFISPNGDFPPWVRLEAWLPGGADPASRERAALDFIIDTKPYHEHTTVISANLTRGRINIAVKERPSFPARYIAEWVAYALDRGPKPGNYTPKLDAFLNAVTSLIPFVHGPHYNPVRREYRTRFSGAMALGLLSLAILVIGFTLVGNHRGYDPPVAGLLILLVGII
jgi:hypothetical protein